MKPFRTFLRSYRLVILVGVLAGVGIAWLLLYRLGSLTGGLNASEASSATTPYGWSGLYHRPLYLPLDLLRSIIYFLAGHHGQLLTRLPNVVFGAAAMVTFACLIRIWHGNRTAILAGVLFATSAWVLHVSRLASNDVLYLWLMPTLLVAHVTLQKRTNWAVAYYGNLLLWGLLLYVPGAIWLLALNGFWLRSSIIQSWRYFGRLWQRLLAGLALVVWLPLLVIDLGRQGRLVTWLGLPQHLAPPLSLLKQFGEVFVHLFIRGPGYPQLWLGHAPVLDIFTLLMTGLGIYFYVSHWKVGRSRLIASWFVIGLLLVGLGGPVSLSLLVPLVYICAATGIAFLLHEWLKVFPVNPLARALGISLMVCVVALSTVYNLRAYFVAWPDSPTTKTVFNLHR